LTALGVLYRVRQFTLALGAQSDHQTACDLSEYLDARQQALFRGMPAMDRHHCLAVFASLREAGHADPSLLRAALLHDVGKTVGPVRIWHRVVAVLVKALAPRQWETLEGQAGTWRYPFHVHRHHAELGAELARQAGYSPEAVWLIAHHEDQENESHTEERRRRLLATLQAADQVN
jgi:putative nucleotidyltransferase with HDIG domain